MEGYTYAANVCDFPLVQGPFSVALSSDSELSYRCVYAVDARRLEQRVEYEYKDFLVNRCKHERKRQRQVNTWDRQKARNMELKHCDELNRWV
jgi:hypothetical protein